MPKSSIILPSVLKNIYINTELYILNPSSEVLDLGAYMSGDCTFIFRLQIYMKNTTI